MKRPQVNRIKKRLALIHDMTAKHAEGAHEIHEISCSEGCSHCCRQVVTVSVFEAILILDWIASDKVRKDWYVKSILPKVKEQYEMSMRDETTTATWFDEMIACVFLSDEGKCTVYDQRPFPCRALYVITPSSQCAPPRGALIGAVDFGHLRQDLLREEQRMARHFDITFQQAPLPVALHWASIALFQGPRKLAEQLRGTVFEKDLPAMLYWAKKFGDPEHFAALEAEIAQTIEERVNGEEATSSI